MKTIVNNTRGLAVFFETNMDRFLVPITIVGALTLAGWLVSLLPL